MINKTQSPFNRTVYDAIDSFKWTIDKSFYDIKSFFQQQKPSLVQSTKHLTKVNQTTLFSNNVPLQSMSTITCSLTSPIHIQRAPSSLSNVSLEPSYFSHRTITSTPLLSIIQNIILKSHHNFKITIDRNFLVIKIIIPPKNLSQILSKYLSTIPSETPSTIENILQNILTTLTTK